MMINNTGQHLSAGIMTFMLLGLMYSFGTFGLLNIFGVRVAVQLILISAITLFFIAAHVRFKKTDLFFLLTFSCTYAIGSFIHGGMISRSIDAYILIFCFVAIFYTPSKHILFLSKALVLTTTILSGLILIAFIYYQIYPYEIHKANFTLYSSNVGSDRIYPGNFIDFFSFTSGDGFKIGGLNIIRMKGYSNEPSSTIVHYLAPAAVAFILGGRFVYLGVFILVVNIVAIVSFVSIIILLLSFMFVAIKVMPKALRTILLFLSLSCFLTLILSPSLVLEVFRIASSIALDFAGLDFLSRKIGDGSYGISGGSNLGERHFLIMNAFDNSLTSPFGYPESQFGKNAVSLFHMISARAGWIGLFILGAFIISLGKYIKATFLMNSSLITLFGVALIISVFLVVLFISGYGWSRPPGIIMSLLYFRLLGLVVYERNALPAFKNQRFVRNPTR